MPDFDYEAFDHDDEEEVNNDQPPRWEVEEITTRWED
jgi:hypothetical protein